MRTLIIILLGFLFFSFGGNSSKRTHDFKGKVKKISESCYSPKSANADTAVEQLQYTVIHEYDSLGNETRKTEKDATGAYAGSTIDYKYVITYDNKGNIVEHAESLGGAAASVTRSKYNDSGKLIEQEELDNKGDLKDRLIYKYDAAGSAVEEDNYDVKGQLTFKYTFKYDDNGNEILEDCFSPSAGEQEKVMCKYDSKGNVIEYTSLSGGHIFQRRYTKTYNEMNDPIEMTNYNGDGKMVNHFTYTYEYDKVGNWIKEIDHNGDKPTQVIKRVIEYYQ